MSIVDSLKWISFAIQEAINGDNHNLLKALVLLEHIQNAIEEELE